MKTTTKRRERRFNFTSGILDEDTDEQLNTLLGVASADNYGECK